MQKILKVNQGSFLAGIYIKHHGKIPQGQTHREERHQIAVALRRAVNQLSLNRKILTEVDRQTPDVIDKLVAHLNLRMQKQIVVDGLRMIAKNPKILKPGRMKPSEKHEPGKKDAGVDKTKKYQGSFKQPKVTRFTDLDLEDPLYLSGEDLGLRFLRKSQVEKLVQIQQDEE